MQVAERWIVARLRHERFFTLAALNARIAELLVLLNAKPMRHYGGASRRDLFERLDRPALRPLPVTPYEYAEWKPATVNIDYHIAVDHHAYSVPHALVHERVEVRLTATVVEIFHRGQRVAVHPRSAQRGGFTTNGTGKTYLACALAQQACRQGARALYRRVPRLFEELTLAHADGSYIRLLARFARADVLVLDDFGLGGLRDQDRRDLLEILEDRTGTRSTIITSQLPPAKWHDYVADETTADAICDRLLHPAHRLALKGPSRRKDSATN